MRLSYKIAQSRCSSSGGRLPQPSAHRGWQPGNGLLGQDQRAGPSTSPRLRGEESWPRAPPHTALLLQMEKAQEAQVPPAESLLERHHGQPSEGLPGPGRVAKIKPAANQALSEASGIKPARGLGFPATRGKAALCPVNIPRQSSPQWEEDSRTNADPKPQPAPSRALPPASRSPADCALKCVYVSPCRWPLSLQLPGPGTVGGPAFLEQNIPP